MLIWLLQGFSPDALIFVFQLLYMIFSGSRVNKWSLQLNPSVSFLSFASSLTLPQITWRETIDSIEKQHLNNLTQWYHKCDTSLCINLWDGHSILNTDAKETPGISYVRDPYHCCSTPMGQGTLLYKLTQNLGGNHWEGVGISHPP